MLQKSMLCNQKDVLSVYLVVKCSCFKFFEFLSLERWGDATRNKKIRKTGKINKNIHACLWEVKEDKEVKEVKEVKDDACSYSNAHQQQ